jgi:hypothetical protein
MPSKEKESFHNGNDALRATAFATAQSQNMISTRPCVPVVSDSEPKLLFLYPFSGQAVLPPW